MKSARKTLRIVLAAAALSSALPGCAHEVSSPNAAPNMTPADNRQDMIKWHKEHDQKPAVPAPGG